MKNIYEDTLQFRGSWRDYQDRVLQNSQKYLADGKLHIVAAPGSGKTTLGIELLRRLGEPCLILSPSITIRQQWLERIMEGFLLPGREPEELLSNDLRHMKCITAITYQALYSAMKHYQGQLSDGDDESEEDERESEAVDFRDFDIFDAVKAAGIKTLSYDRLILNAGTDLYVSFDNKAVGTLMAKALKNAIPDGGDIFMIQGAEEDNNVKLVREGFEEELEGSNLNVVYQANCAGWLAEQAVEYLDEALQEFPDVKGIMCGNDDIASQVVRVLAEHRLAGKVQVVGQDGDLAACQRIVEGTQTMTAFKSVELQAKVAARYAVNMAKGEELERINSSINDGSEEIPFCKLQPIAVTSKNMDEIIIDAGFHSEEDVYLNVMKEQEEP